MFKFFKKRKQLETEMFQELFGATQFRHNLDQILSAHSLGVEKETTNKLALEVISVVVFITRKSIEFAGRDYRSLSESEAFAASLVSIVAADHITRLAHLPFEAVCLVVGAALWGPSMGGEKAAELFHDALEEFNRLAQHPEHQKLLTAIGNNVAKFFSSNDMEYLKKVGEVTKWMMSKPK